MRKIPQISIVLPTYNGKYLEESIKSLMSQTFRDFQIILIDDGSSKVYRSVVDKLSSNNKKIKMIRHSKNMGLIYSLNEGLKLASQSKYIVRMDDDDIAIIDRLEKQYVYMENNKDVDISGTWIEVFGTYNYVWKTPVSNEEICAKMIFECPLGHPSVILRGSTVDRLRIRYPSDLPSAEDYALWQSLTGKVTFANMPEVLLKHRMHNTQIGTAKKEEQQRSSMIVRRRALRLIDMNSSNSEDLIHSKLSSWVHLENRSETIIMGNWLNQIRKKNRIHNVYNPRFLNKTLSDRLIIELFISKNLSLSDKLLFLRYPLTYESLIKIFATKIMPSYFPYNL